MRLLDRFQGDAGGDGIGCCCIGEEGEGGMFGSEPSREFGKEADDRSGRPPNRPLSVSLDREAFEDGILIGCVEKVTDAERERLDAEVGGVAWEGRADL